MTTRRRVPNTRINLPRETVEAILAKEALLSARGQEESAETFAEAFASSDIPGTRVVWGGYWSNSAAERRLPHLVADFITIYADPFLFYTACRATKSGRIGLHEGYNKVVTQMRGVGTPQSPLISEPVAETDFTYPKDKVVAIRKGLRLKKRG